MFVLAAEARDRDTQVAGAVVAADYSAVSA
jgi:hypothetical protein